MAGAEIDTPHAPPVALTEERVSPRGVLPAERKCCGTFPGSPHRANCERSKRNARRPQCEGKEGS